MVEKQESHIVVKDITLAYGSNVVQQNVSFTINRGDVFIIMGGSGCGKSTIMRGLTGLDDAVSVSRILGKKKRCWNPDK